MEQPKNLEEAAQAEGAAALKVTVDRLRSVLWDARHALYVAEDDMKDSFDLATVRDTIKKIGRELAGHPLENCTWEEDADGVWHGTCGISWVLDSDDPSGNGMNYCPKCGKPLRTEPHVLHKTNKALRGEGDICRKA